MNPRLGTDARGSRSTGTVTPILGRVGYFRGSTLTVGHLSRSFTTIHIFWTTSFSSDNSSSHAGRFLSSSRCSNRELNVPALFGLQLTGGEAAHGQTVDYFERKLTRGVVPARELEDLVP